jgi:MYXO-CTERM domain-containing protein
MTKLNRLLRAGAIAFLLLLGLVTARPVTAQDAATEVATQASATVNQAADTAKDDDGGFDDWGLFGLLGLLGLGGLLRRPKPVVHETDRTGFTSASDRIDNRGL